MIETKEQLMALAHTDPKYIIESGFWVVNKDKEIVPFLFNEPQTLFYDERTYRDDLLKAGQLGLSTEILGILTVKFLLVPNSWSVCISHDEESTKRLFDRVDFFLSHLPDWLKVFYRPTTDNEKNLVNGTMNSRFYIGTAGARAFGRGDTIHYAHMSESSRWRDAGKVMTGILRAVPLNDPKTWIVKETTANGQGTLHHIEYQRAKTHRSEFTSHFLPFFSNPDYRIQTVIKPEDFTEKEKKLLQRFPEKEAKRNKGFIDAEVLAWRRHMIATLPSEDGRQPEEMFMQEFPVDDQEAFLFSGNPVFPVEQTENYKVKIKDPIMTGNLEGIPPNESISQTERGWYKFWDMPSVGSQYIIFADVGEFSDFCSAHVLDKKTWKRVAHLHGLIKPSQFGDELNKLGHFFNKALIAVEVNNMGHSTIDRLRTLNYPNMYMRERLNHKEKKVTLEFGWETTSKTKPLMIGYLQDLIRTEQIPDIDYETLGEIITYIKHPDGSLGASEGNKDDRVISLAGAYYILKLHPFAAPMQKQQTSAENKVRLYRQLRSTKKAMNRFRR